MTDLTKFRDHCRASALLTHKPECPSLAEPRWVEWVEGEDLPRGAQVWRAMNLKRLPPPTCDGCMTAADRDLFRRLADEADAYLAPSTTAPDLFGGASEQGVAS